MRRAARNAMCGAIVASAAMLGSHPAQAQGNWTFSGGDLTNTRNGASETTITASSVGGLKVKWALATHGDVSATPTAETDSNGRTTVYAVDWGGYIYSVDGKKGAVNWSNQVKNYTGNTVLSVARTAPAIVGNTLVFGDQGDAASSGFPQGGGTTASVMAVNKADGSLVWRTVVSDHPLSIISSSPVAYNGVVYVGVASLEENAGFIPGWVFSWRGKVVALDANTGALLWSFKTIDDASYAAGYTGASVWGSTPVVDPKRGSLYVSTGNNYTGLPQHTSPGGQPAPAGDHFDSVLALNLSTGALKWAYRAWNGDVWDVASWVNSGATSYNYPDNSALGPDWDFGSGPMLIRTKSGDIVGAGAKSGLFYGLNPDTGAVLWTTQAGPGGTGGGIEWGSASDGTQVYCAVTNSDYKPNMGGTGGNWTAIDVASGHINWQTADPLYPNMGTKNGITYGGGHDPGMVTVANGVVFAGSSGLAGNAPFAPNGAPGGFFALSATTGKILWQFTSANDPDLGSVNSGASVVNGVVYWGSGYSHLMSAFGISGHQPKLYAFGP